MRHVPCHGKTITWLSYYWPAQPCTETNRDSQQTEKKNIVVEPEKTKAIRRQYTAKQMERVVILWLRCEIWIRQY